MDFKSGAFHARWKAVDVGRSGFRKRSRSPRVSSARDMARKNPHEAWDEFLRVYPLPPPLPHPRIPASPPRWVGTCCLETRVREGGVSGDDGCLKCWVCSPCWCWCPPVSQDEEARDWQKSGGGRLSRDAGGSRARALIIDGQALIFALAPSSREPLASLATKCAAVVCCRVSPDQKREVRVLEWRWLGCM